MARINLLPWREELRQQKKREFAVVAGGSAIFMAGVVLLVHMHISGLISYQNSRNNYLENEIKRVEAKIKEIENLETQKEQLIARMRIIERLQRNRPEVVHVFDELVRLTPEGLYLDKMEQRNDRLTIEGYTQSNARVSAFMRNLDKSEWFTQPSLDKIERPNQGKKEEDVELRYFKLMVNQHNPQEE